MKTNHQRNFKETMRNNAGSRSWHYNTICLKRTALDGSVVVASANAGDHTSGKHGIAKDRKGAKKFVHSRIRRKDREELKKIGAML